MSTVIVQRKTKKTAYDACMHVLCADAMNRNTALSRDENPESAES